VALRALFSLKRLAAHPGKDRREEGGRLPVAGGREKMEVGKLGR